MTHITISIVTSVLNRSTTIGDTIESVRSQSYQAIEHIIQDGGSRDGTHDVIARLAAPNIVFNIERDKGIYDGLNRGISKASGDVIGLLHSDDVFSSSSVIEKIAHAFKDQQVDGVYGDLDYVASADLNRVVRRWRSGEYRLENLRKGWMPPHPTLFLRRRIFQDFGLYDLDYKIAADYEAMLRWLTRGHIRLSYIPEVLVRMRLGGESNRSLRNLIQKSTEDYRAIKTHQVGGLGTLFLKNARKLSQFI